MGLPSPLWLRPRPWSGKVPGSCCSIVLLTRRTTGHVDGEGRFGGAPARGGGPAHLRGGLEQPTGLGGCRAQEGLPESLGPTSGTLALDSPLRAGQGGGAGALVIGPSGPEPTGEDGCLPWGRPLKGRDRECCPGVPQPPACPPGPGRSPGPLLSPRPGLSPSPWHVPRALACPPGPCLSPRPLLIPRPLACPSGPCLPPGPRHVYHQGSGCHPYSSPPSPAL